MATQSATRMTKPNRRWMLWGGLVSLEFLLIGAAFVGGRMLGEQNLRSVRPAGAAQLPSQLPKDPAAGSGTVQKIQDTVITLGRGFGGPQGGGGQSTSNQTEVAVTAETKYYKNTSSGAPGNPGAGQPQIQIADATIADVKIGSNVMVWGPKNGERITAEVIYIQSAGR